MQASANDGDHKIKTVPPSQNWCKKISGMFISNAPAPICILFCCFANVRKSILLHDDAASPNNREQIHIVRHAIATRDQPKLPRYRVLALVLQR